MPIYMHIPDLPGLSTVKGYEGWHIVDSYSWDCHTPPSQQASKVIFSPFVVNFAPTLSAPKMMVAVCTGRHQKRILVAATNGQGQETVRYALEQPILIGLSQGYANGESGPPMTSLSFNFTKITYKVTVQRPDGSSFVQAGEWNLVTNGGA